MLGAEDGTFVLMKTHEGGVVYILSSLQMILFDMSRFPKRKNSVIHCRNKSSMLAGHYLFMKRSCIMRYDKGITENNYM